MALLHIYSRLLQASVSLLGTKNAYLENKEKKNKLDHRHSNEAENKIVTVLVTTIIVITISITNYFNNYFLIIHLKSRLFVIIGQNLVLNKN